MSRRHLFFLFFIAIVFLIASGIQTSSQNSPQEIIAGRNVNMVSGTKLPYGDPWLQRQNEPSIAVSTRNPLHLLAGANDYRTIDMPEELLGEVPGQEEKKATAPAGREPWLGVFKSFDGGQSWITTLLPGFPLDKSPDGLASPLWMEGWEAAADPVVRAGTNGLFYYSGIAFHRDTKEGVLFVARFIDNNNLETSTTNRDCIKYLDTKIIARGSGGIFIDKPWIAVDLPHGKGQKVIIDGQNISRHSIYIAFAEFTGTGDTLKSTIRFAQSEDCGDTWSVPIQLSTGNDANQGATIAVDPRGNGHICVAWRRFAKQNNKSSNSIFIARSVNGGKKFNKVIEIASFDPFDQGSSAVTFRTNSYPTLAVDDTGRIYLAWSKRIGEPPSEDARIVLSTSKNGITWSVPKSIDDPGAQGHQIMPSLTFSAGKLMLAWYDQRKDYSERFTKYIDDRTGETRHTLDVRVAEAEPGDNPVFKPSIQVSRYRYILNNNGTLQQVQFNPVNYPLFKAGTWPFIGDYIDIAPSPMFVLDKAGQWQYNSEPSNTAVYHVTWTDNRDVRPPLDGDWINYKPPISTQDDEYSQSYSCVDWTKTGMRNQNVYTSAVTKGIIVGSPGNTKPLGTLKETPDGVGIPRAFVVILKNTTSEIKSFRLSIANQPPNGRASFLEFVDLFELDVKIAPYSSVSRSVFVYSTDPKATVRIDVAEIDVPYGSLIPDGLESYVLLNPEIENPEIENPEIENPEIINDILAYEYHNPEIENYNIFNRVLNPEIINPEIENPEIINPEIINPEIENPEIINPEIENPEIENPEIENPEIENATFSLPPEGEALVLLRLWKPTVQSLSSVNALSMNDITSTLIGYASGTARNTKELQQGIPTYPAAASELIITTKFLNDGKVGQFYSDYITAAGGTKPYTWTYSGSLPDGLNLNTITGEISGTPTTEATYSFTVKVTDSIEDFRTLDCWINVFPAAGGYTISGRVTVSGLGLPGVTMIGLPGNPITDSSGYYSAVVEPNWSSSGPVTPDKAGCTFLPASETYTNVTSNLVTNYTATLKTYTIVGQVTIDGSGLDGVVMNGFPGNPLTNAYGTYSATVDYGWSGTVTPTKDGYTFTPVSRTLTNVTSDLVMNIIIATLNTYTISGQVTIDGSGLGGVVMNGLPGNPITDLNGNYSATVDYGWIGTVMPTMVGYTFFPVNVFYLNIHNDWYNQDYIATINTYTISGTVTLNGSGLQGVVMNGLPGDPQTDTSGFYTATVVYGSSWNVTPAKGGYTFNPSSKTYTSVTENITENYTAMSLTHTVSGTVYYSTTGLDEVTVKLGTGEPRTPPLQATTTDISGHYSFSGVSDGGYWVRADAPSVEYIDWVALSIQVSGSDVTRNIDLPKKMTLLTPASGSNVSDTKPTLTWQANPQATRYTIQVNRTSDWYLVEQGQSTTTSYTMTTTLTVGTNYTWQVDAYDSANHNVGTTAMSFTFTVVAPDTTPPSVTNLSPASGATNVGLDTVLSITFDENVKKGSGAIVIKKRADDAVFQTINVTSGLVTINNNIVSISHNVFGIATVYYVQIEGTCFDDMAGNSYVGITDNSTWTFTTTNSYVDTWNISKDLAGWTANTADNNVAVMDTGGNPGGYLSSQSVLPNTIAGAKTYKAQFTDGYSSSSRTQISVYLKIFNALGYIDNVYIRFRYLDSFHNGWKYPLSKPLDNVWTYYAVTFNPNWTDNEAKSAGWLQEDYSPTFRETMADVYYAEVRIEGHSVSISVGIDNFRRIDNF